MILEIEHLSKSFGGLMAIRDLSLSAKRGEILGLIGPNGSGKTTVFNLISGLLKPNQGKIRLSGMEITDLPCHKICRLGVARTFQLTKPFGQMSSLQNVLVGRVFGSLPTWTLKHAREEAERILEFVGLKEKSKAAARVLGLVDRKRLEVARALATHPKLLLLDEMMAGLTPAEVEEAMGLVEKIKDSGITVIVVEHVMEAIMGISDRIVAISAGEKIAEGNPREVIDNERVIEAYLGKEGDARFSL